MRWDRHVIESEYDNRKMQEWFDTLRCMGARGKASDGQYKRIEYAPKLKQFVVSHDGVEIMKACSLDEAIKAYNEM